MELHATALIYSKATKLGARTACGIRSSLIMCISCSVVLLHISDSCLLLVFCPTYGIFSRSRGHVLARAQQLEAVVVSSSFGDSFYYIVLPSILCTRGLPLLNTGTFKRAVKRNLVSSHQQLWLGRVVQHQFEGIQRFPEAAM